MKSEVLKNKIYSLVSFIGFEYNGISCGVDPISHNHFEMWYGDKDYLAKDINDVMNVLLFNGKSLNDISEQIIITDN